MSSYSKWQILIIIYIIRDPNVNLIMTRLLMILTFCTIEYSAIMRLHTKTLTHIYNSLLPSVRQTVLTFLCRKCINTLTDN